MTENGKECKADWTTVKNYYIYKDGNSFVMIGKDASEKTVFKTWDEATKYLIPTSKDYGWAQVNDCNMTMCYSTLQKLGLWRPDSGRWALDPELNIYMRYIVEEDRIRIGFEKPGDGHWDKVFVEGLMRIDGWEGLWAE